MWQPLPRGRDKIGRWNFEGGLNVGRSSFDVGDDQTVSENGFDTDLFPALKVRQGRTTYGTSGSAITRLLTKFGTSHLVRAVGTALQYNSSGTTWTNITGTFTNTDWDATNFDVSGPALILTNGTDNVKYWNGSSLADLNASDAPKGKYIASDNRRVYIANVTADASDDIVHFCAFQDATDWTTALDAGSVQFYTPGGGAITGMKAFKGQIWVFKRNAVCLIFHTGDSRVTHRLVETSNDVGCVSYKTIVEVGELLFWLGEKDVYIGAGGEVQGIGRSHNKVRSAIDDILDDINTTHLDKCCAFTDGTRYYLNLVTGSDTEPDTRLVYDPHNRIWRQCAEDESYRFGVQFKESVYAGDDGGQTYKVNDGTDDAGTAISWSLETKDFDEGEPEAEKEYYQLYIQGDLPSGSTATVSASVDEGVTYTEIDDLSTDTEAQSVNLILPLDTLNLGHWVRFKIEGTGPFTLYRMERYFRVQPVQI